MVRMVRTGALHNGVPTSYKTEHCGGYNSWAPKKLRKRQKNHRKGKCPSMKGGGR